MPTHLAVLGATALLLVACGGARQPQPSPTAAANQDWSARRVEMLARFPPGAIGSPGERQAFAEALVQAHEERRQQLGAGPLQPSQRATEVAYFAGLPVDQAQETARAESRQRAAALDAELSKLDGRIPSQSDLARLAAASGETVAHVREAIVQRSGRLAAEAATRREVELARLYGTGLADMPREIALAAEQNLADRRSPFDSRTGWRPTPADLRAEEVRVRTAVQARIEAGQRQVASMAAAAQREAIARQCQMQAALAGAATPTPYGGPGIGGALAAGFLGAMQQATVEANALQSCLRASGL